MSKRLVLLGGGHAHVQVLHALATEPMAGADVLLITPFARQMYSGMVPGLVAGHYTAEQCAIPLTPLAAAAGVPMVEGAAVAVGTTARVVHLADGRTAEYDVLSLDTGAGLAMDEGLSDHPGLLPVRPLPSRHEGLDGSGRWQRCLTTRRRGWP